MDNVGIHCDKDIKLRLDAFKQSSVGDASPTLTGNGGYGVIREISQESDRKTFIQNVLHAGTVSSISRLAASNTATTCSRFTVGKSYKKGSIESPSSRQSNKFCAGTRVPAKTGVPPRTSGDDVIMFAKPFMTYTMPNKDGESKSD